MPSTKPYLKFDRAGVCDACSAAQTKKDAIAGIDWASRLADFEALISWAVNQRAPFYDALVPVSGGKDSITQVHRLLNRGLRILAVNVDYGLKTEIGLRNLQCVPAMGANLITLRPELDLHKRLIRIGLEDFGDPDLMSHTLLHAYPLHVAQRFQIPLCLLGENSAFEYGGDQELAAAQAISRNWFNSYAANKGITATVVSERYDIPFSRLWQYDYPDSLDQDNDIRAVFCSAFFPWDSNEHLRIAVSYGFSTLDHPGEGTYRNFVGVDEKINRLHQYLKVLKYGYGRATDHASEDIRAGLITREEGKQLVKEFDLQPLSRTLVADIADFLGYAEIELERIIEGYRNLDIWDKSSAGDWFIPGHLEVV